MAQTPNPFIEVTRSFSFKKNIGNYQSLDLFFSQKAECSPENAAQTSRMLVEFCRNEVAKDIAELQESHPEFFRADRLIIRPIASSDTEARDEDNAIERMREEREQVDDQIDHINTDL